MGLAEVRRRSRSWFTLPDYGQEGDLFLKNTASEAKQVGNNSVSGARRGPAPDLQREVSAPISPLAPVSGRFTALNGLEPAGWGRHRPGRPYTGRKAPETDPVCPLVASGWIPTHCDTPRGTRGTNRALLESIALRSSVFCPFGPVCGSFAGKKTSFPAKFGPGQMAEARGWRVEKMTQNQKCVPSRTSLTSSKTE